MEHTRHMTGVTSVIEMTGVIGVGVMEDIKEQLWEGLNGMEWLQDKMRKKEEHTGSNDWENSQLMHILTSWPV